MQIVSIKIRLKELWLEEITSRIEPPTHCSYKFERIARGPYRTETVQCIVLDIIIWPTEIVCAETLNILGLNLCNILY